MAANKLTVLTDKTEAFTKTVDNEPSMFSRAWSRFLLITQDNTYIHGLGWFGPSEAIFYT